MAPSFFKKIFNFKIILIINLFFLFIFGFNFLKEYNRSRELRREIVKLEAAAKEVKAKNLDIFNIIKYLDTEEFLEQEARLKLGLGRAEEKTFILNTAEEEAKSQKKEEKELSNPQKWWNYFFQ